MKKMKWDEIDIKNIALRCVMYMVGLFVLALGVSFSVISNLGVSPLNSIPYVVSEILQKDLGVCTTCVFVIFIGIQVLMMRKEFQWKNLFQIVNSTLFGFCVSAVNVLTSWIVVENNYLYQLFFCFLGIIFIALGLYIYLECHILSLPAEGVMEAMMYRFKIERPRAKMIFDGGVVTIACAISFLVMGNIVGIREGTILAAIGVGPCLKGIQAVVGKIRNKCNK